MISPLGQEAQSIATPTTGFLWSLGEEMGIIISSLAKVVQIDEGEYVARHDENPSSLRRSRYIREVNILELSWCSRRLQSRAEEL